jgi:Golgi nucleoside diphosphatase
VVSPYIGHGVMIDAGSGGSRAHVFEWEPRIFSELPPPISFPKSHSKWTGRYSPGIATYFDKPDKVAEHLRPMLDFAKEVLKDKQEHWHQYPIYLKATGGMRQLTYDQRQRLMESVRQVLYNKEACPFLFEYEHARVISGEEEGIYGWTAINFLEGNLLLSSRGVGTAYSNYSVGSLDMGGSSTQISFFKRDADIMSNLFKLQVGAQKHWNVYTHSFLYFGSTSARLRMQQDLVDARNGVIRPFWRLLEDADGRASAQTRRLQSWDGSGEFVNIPLVPEDLGMANLPNLRHLTDGANAAAAGTNWSYTSNTTRGDHVILDACMPFGYSMGFTAVDGKSYTLASRSGGQDSYAKCVSQIKPLLHTQLNTWCNFAHSGQCSLAGIYQPSLPNPKDAPFYAYAGYYKAWSGLWLPEKCPLGMFQERVEYVCSMSWSQLLNYNKGLPDPLKTDELWNLCFMGSYALTLMTEGYGFSLDSRVQFVDELAGYKVGWALGSMLYEINSLPWVYNGTGQHAEQPTYLWVKGHLESMLPSQHVHFGHLFLSFLLGGALAVAAVLIVDRSRSSARRPQGSRDMSGYGAVEFSGPAEVSVHLADEEAV